MVPKQVPVTTCILTAGFVSAPNLTAAAAAQNLTWAPVSVTGVTVTTYTLVLPTLSSALVTLTLAAELGISGDISSVAPSASISGRRRLAQSSRGKPMLMITLAMDVIVTATAIAIVIVKSSRIGNNSDDDT